MSRSIYPSSGEPVWFLDCFGHVLCYTPHKQALARLPFQGMLFSGCVMAPYPLPERFTPQWYNIFGDVVKSPEYEIRNEGENLVSLYRPDLNAYVSINPARNNTSFSDGCYDWEKFCPLPYDVFMGFLYLTHPNASEVRLEETGERLPRLWFPLPSNDKLFIADFGRRRITIRDNLEAFAKVGRLQEGETVSVRFNGYMPGRVYDLTVKRLGEFTF